MLYFRLRKLLLTKFPAEELSLARDLLPLHNPGVVGCRQGRHATGDCPPPGAVPQFDSPPVFVPKITFQDKRIQNGSRCEQGREGQIDPDSPR